MKRRIRKYSILATIGIVLPLLALTAAVDAPGLAVSMTQPPFRLYSPPQVARSGQHVVFTLPLEKVGTCEPVAPPYASFEYRDDRNVSHVETYDLRNADRHLLATQPLLNTGERKKLGPFVLFVTRDAAERATSFQVSVECKSATGKSALELGRVPLPETSLSTGAELLRMFHGAALSELR